MDNERTYASEVLARALAELVAKRVLQERQQEGDTSTIQPLGYDSGPDHSEWGFEILDAPTLGYAVVRVEMRDQRPSREQ